MNFDNIIKGQSLVVTRFYADTLAGATGVVKKKFKDTYGNPFVVLELGRNLTNQPIRNIYPLDCVAKLKTG